MVIKRVFSAIVWVSLILWSFSSSAEVIDLTSKIHFGQSEHGVQNPEEVQYQPHTAPEIKQGYTSRDQWIYLELSNPTDVAIDKILYFDSPLIGKIKLFKKHSLEPPIITGSTIPWSQRGYASRLGAFKIHLKPNETAQYYIKRVSHHALNTRLFLADEADFEKNEVLAKTVFYFYLGGILCLVIYNLLLGLFTRYKDYLVYAFFAASFAVTGMDIHDVLDSYLLKDFFFNFSNYLMFFASVTLFAATLFVRRFLNINKDFKVGYYGSLAVGASAIVTLAASFFVPTVRDLYFLGYWIDVSITFAILFFIYCGLYSYYRFGNRLASFFLLSWLVVVFGTSIWFLSIHGFIPFTTWTQYSLLLANLGEMLVLSLGLAYKIRVLEEEKTLAEQAAQEKERYHRLVRVMSHDVSNTVSGMILHTEMIKEYCAEEGPHHLHIEHLLNSTKQLTQILESVRNEEVLQSFKFSLKLKPVNLREACAEAVKHLNWQMNRKNIKVEIQVPDNRLVWADKFSLVNQVLSNVISNSIKFSDPGQTLVFSIEEGRTEFILKIVDQGVGVQADELKHLYKGTKHFTHKGTQNEAGTGLGSYLVSEYMKLFDGRVEVQSVPRSESEKSGTTVFLYFKKALQ